MYCWSRRPNWNGFPVWNRICWPTAPKFCPLELMEPIYFPCNITTIFSIFPRVRAVIFPKCSSLDRISRLITILRACLQHAHCVKVPLKVWCSELESQLWCGLTSTGSCKEALHPLLWHLTFINSEQEQSSAPCCGYFSRQGALRSSISNSGTLAFTPWTYIKSSFPQPVLMELIF